MPQLLTRQKLMVNKKTLTAHAAGVRVGLMTFHAAILAALLAVPPNSLESMHETAIARAVRLDALAAVIERAADTASCYERSNCRPVVDRYLGAAVLVVQAIRETGLRLDVQLGHCRPHECDRGRARGPWQLHRWPSVPRAEWLAYAGEDAAGLELGAVRALRLWAGGASRGRGCGFALLAGRPGECSPFHSPSTRWLSRRDAVDRIEARLRRAE